VQCRNQVDAFDGMRIAVASKSPVRRRDAREARAELLALGAQPDYRGV
jgi:hypothetical protein